jgi:hypothetical protein
MTSGQVSGTPGQATTRLAVGSEDRKWRDWSREQLHRIGAWGTLNALKQHFDVTAARAKQIGAEGGEMTPNEIADMARHLPIGSNVTIYQTAETTGGTGGAAEQSPRQPKPPTVPSKPPGPPPIQTGSGNTTAGTTPQPPGPQTSATVPQQPANSNGKRKLTNGLLAGVLGLGILGTGYGIGSKVAKPKPYSVPGVLEWELKSDGRRTLRSGSRSVGSVRSEHGVDQIEHGTN